MSFEEIALHLSSNSISSVEKQLQTLIEIPIDINAENLAVLKQLFQSADVQILQLTAQAVAEHAKNEKSRKVLTNADITQLLLKQLHIDNSDVVHQTFRAIGNICFENESGSTMVGEGGLHQILEVIKRYQDDKNQDAVHTGWGVVFNLLTTSEALVKASLKLNILTMIEHVLSDKQESNDSLVQQLLAVLNSVVDEIEEMHHVQLKKLCYDVIRIMKTTANLEIGTFCLEFLFSQAESREFATSDLFLLIFFCGFQSNSG